MTDSTEVGVNFGADFWIRLLTPISDCVSSALDFWDDSDQQLDPGILSVDTGYSAELHWLEAID